MSAIAAEISVDDYNLACEQADLRRRIAPLSDERRTELYRLIERQIRTATDEAARGERTGEGQMPSLQFAAALILASAALGIGAILARLFR